MRAVRLGGAEIELHDDGLTVTRYSARAVVEAAAQDSDEYRRRAQELGYGTDTARMSRDHEISHSLLAHWLGRPASPTLIEIAHGRKWKHWRLEEAAVLALQAYAIAARVDLTALAIRISQQD